MTPLKKRFVANTFIGRPWQHFLFLVFNGLPWYFLLCISQVCSRGPCVCVRFSKTQLIFQNRRRSPRRVGSCTSHIFLSLMRDLRRRCFEVNSFRWAGGEARHTLTPRAHAQWTALLPWHFSAHTVREEGTWDIKHCQMFLVSVNWLPQRRRQNSFLTL